MKYPLPSGINNNGFLVQLAENRHGDGPEEAGSARSARRLVAGPAEVGGAPVFRALNGRLAEAGFDRRDEEVRRYDRTRKSKKVSNEEWASATDPASRIAQMKDGRTHLASKAEHVVDLASDAAMAAEIYHGDAADTQTFVDSVIEARIHVQAAVGSGTIEEVAADKGCHAAETLESADAFSFRTYIPEPKRKHPRSWTDKPAGCKRSVANNRRRTSRAKSKRLQKRRSERCERTFAHICDTSGMRRSWLRGLEDVGKRYVIAAAADNLVAVRTGKPRALQSEGGSPALAHRLASRIVGRLAALIARPAFHELRNGEIARVMHISTG